MQRGWCRSGNDRGLYNCGDCASQSFLVPARVCVGGTEMLKTGVEWGEKTRWWGISWTEKPSRTERWGKDGGEDSRLTDDSSLKAMWVTERL